MIKQLKLKRVAILLCFSLLAFLFAFLSFFVFTAKAETANKIVFESSASFRVSKNSTGIRFKAYIDKTTAQTLFNYEEKNAVSYKDDSYVIGMVIAPSKAFDIPEGNKYFSKKDYLNYITDKTDGLGRAKDGVCVDFSFEKNNFFNNEDGTVSVKGAIVELNKFNLNYYYRAVVYYTLDGVNFVYSELSSEALLAELADNLLTNDVDEVDPAVLDDVYAIVANTTAMKETGDIAVKKPSTGEYYINVENYELEYGSEKDISSLVFGQDEDYDFKTVSGSVNLKDGIIEFERDFKAKLTLSSYNGKIKYYYNFLSEPFLKIVENLDGKGVTVYKIVTDYKGEGNHIPNSSGRVDFAKMINEPLYKYKGWGKNNNSFFAPITSPASYSANDRYIVIGNCAYSRLAGFADYEGPSVNDYKIAVKGNSIFILGNVSALRFGIYELLYRMVGYELLAFNSNYNYVNTGAITEEVVINDNKDVKLFKSQIEVTSALSIPINIGFSAGGIYANKYGATVSRLASLGYIYGSERGGGSSYNDNGMTWLPNYYTDYQYHVRGGHNTLGFYPYETYKNTHDEWYAKKLDGKGNYVDNMNKMDEKLASEREEPTQLCFYNLYADAVAHANDKTEDLNNDPVDIFMRVARRYTGRVSISLSNMDHGGFCDCPHCTNGNFAYWYFMFANELAKAMKQDDLTKNMKLVLLVYSAISSNLPLDKDGNPRVILENNVGIQFAYNYADYYAGFSTADRERITDVGKFLTGGGMTIWLYCVKTNYEMFFFDDFTNMQSKFQFMAENGVTCMEDEGDTGSAEGTNFANLRIYLEGKLAQNVNADYDALTDKFFDNYFGVASKQMRDVFEKQKQLQQYAHDNWDALYHEGYYRAPKSVQNAVPQKNSIGNDLIGTYSSSTYHYWVSGGFHGNRYILSLIFPKEDLEYMLAKTDSAIASIVNANISESRKEQLVSRILLEKVALIYDYCFIFDDNFATKNASFQGAQGKTQASLPQVLSSADLKKYIGCDTIDEVKALFYQLCRYFNMSSVGYKNLTTDSDTYPSVYTSWKLSENENANIDNATYMSAYKTSLLNSVKYSVNYVLNGGKNNPDNPLTYSTQSDDIFIFAPSRKGYNFSGWSEGNVIKAGSKGDKTFTANWKAIEYKINYVLDGGTNDKENPLTYTIEDQITLNAPTKDGFIFKCWTNDGVIPSGSTGEVTFTAVWYSNVGENGVEYVAVGDNYFIKSITSNNKSLTILTVFNGRKVVGILGNALENCPNLVKINFNANKQAWESFIKADNWDCGKSIEIVWLSGNEDGIVHDSEWKFD